VNEPPASAAQIRPAEPRDVAGIHRLILALAEFEQLAHTVTASESDLADALFGAGRSAEALVAERDGRGAGDGAALVGFALFFTNYSTFVGRPGLHLEDLFVLPEERGCGTGTALLTELARLGAQRGSGRLEWMVLDWNERAISFYERCGATVHREWLLARLTADGIAAVATGTADRPAAAHTGAP
jgi:GNAT superfamily N-acetyltransferase